MLEIALAMADAGVVVVVVADADADAGGMAGSDTGLADADIIGRECLDSYTAKRQDVPCPNATVEREMESEAKRNGAERSVQP